MLRFDKATYPSIVLNVIFSESLSMRIECFVVLRTHKYSIHFVSSKI